MCVHVYVFVYFSLYSYIANEGQTIDLPYYNVFQYP